MTDVQCKAIMATILLANPRPVKGSVILAKEIFELVEDIEDEDDYFCDACSEKF